MQDVALTNKRIGMPPRAEMKCECGGGLAKSA